MRLNCLSRLSFILVLDELTCTFANPLERCLVLGTVAKRAAPVPGALNRCPEASLLASETQPSILNHPEDEPGKCHSKEGLYPGEPPVSTHGGNS